LFGDGSLRFRQDGVFRRSRDPVPDARYFHWSEVSAGVDLFGLRIYCNSSNTHNHAALRFRPQIGDNTFRVLPFGFPALPYLAINMVTSH
jgi:hypothetical protein